MFIDIQRPNISTVRNRRIFFGQTLSSNSTVVDVALGVEKPQMTSIHLYPNLAKNELNVSSADGNIESLVIRDMVGKVVFQSQTSFQNATFNISDLKPGIYNISLEKDDR